MFYEFFRLFGLISFYPVHNVVFIKKTYYEDKENTNFKTGGKLIIANHYNFLDYVLSAYTVFPRKLRAVTGEMVFKSKIQRFFMRFFGLIQANRISQNMSFIETAADAIKSGELVLIFPEGHNTPDGKIHTFKQSYILIAHQANTPIVPIVSDGNYGFFKKVHMIIGKEIYIKDILGKEVEKLEKEDRTKINDYIYNKVLSLRETLEDIKKSKKNKKGK